MSSAGGGLSHGVAADPTVALNRTDHVHELACAHRACWVSGPTRRSSEPGRSGAGERRPRRELFGKP